MFTEQNQLRSVLPRTNAELNGYPGPQQQIKSQLSSAREEPSMAKTAMPISA